MEGRIPEIGKRKKEMIKKTGKEEEEKERKGE